MKKKTYKLAKAERKRKSIIYNDLTHCAVCGSLYNINLHEVFYGKNRINSIKYGCVMPLCPEHHTYGKFAIHNNKDMDLFYKKMFQEELEKSITREEFISIFHINYLQ